VIWGAPREVAARSIIAPGDLRQRQKQPHVVALAETFRRFGDRPGNRCWVVKRSKGWELVAGRDRFAALMLNESKRVPVEEVVDATPDELADLEEIENLYRRPVKDRDALIAAHVAKVAARLEAERGGSGTAVPKPNGRPKTVKAEASEKVAAAMQSTPAAVRQAVKRAEAKERDGAGGPTVPMGQSGDARPSTGAPPPPIDTYGHPLPDDVRDLVVPVVDAMRVINAKLVAAQGCVSVLSTLVGADQAVEQRIREAIHDAAAFTRSRTPTHLCPYCLGKKPARGCTVCKRLGAVPRDVFEAAPAAMRLNLVLKAVGLPKSNGKAKREMTVNGRPLSEVQAAVEGGDDESIPF
jgi:hypothetical protein